MFTETGVVVALAHVLMPVHGAVGVGRAAAARPADRERGGVAGRGARSPCCAASCCRRSCPGILSGAIIVFALAASAFATPAIIGGRRLKVASTLAYDEFLNTLNWPLGAAVAVLLLVALVAIVGRRQPAGRAPLRGGVRMSRTRPALALAFHTLFVIFMLAPILVVCFVAFTPEGFLSFPTDRWSLRWFKAIGRYPEFIRAFWRSLWLGALSSAIAVAFVGAGGAGDRALSLPRPRGA